jgi:hypothetical protein
MELFGSWLGSNENPRLKSGEHYFVDILFSYIPHTLVWGTT